MSTWASIESREATERKVTGESIATFSRWSSTIRHSAASSTAIREFANGTLNELQARVFVAQRAVQEGRGGVSRLARLTGMSRPTILKGIAELESGALEARAEIGRVPDPASEGEPTAPGARVAKTRRQSAEGGKAIEALPAG